MLSKIFCSFDGVFFTGSYHFRDSVSAIICSSSFPGRILFLSLCHRKVILFGSMVYVPGNILSSHYSFWCNRA